MSQESKQLSPGCARGADHSAPSTQAFLSLLMVLEISPPPPCPTVGKPGAAGQVGLKGSQDWVWFVLSLFRQQILERGRTLPPEPAVRGTRTTKINVLTSSPHRGEGKSWN